MSELDCVCVSKRDLKRAFQIRLSIVDRPATQPSCRCVTAVAADIGDSGRCLGLESHKHRAAVTAPAATRLCLPRHDHWTTKTSTLSQQTALARRRRRRASAPAPTQQQQQRWKRQRSGAASGAYTWHSKLLPAPGHEATDAAVRAGTATAVVALPQPQPQRAALEELRAFALGDGGGGSGGGGRGGGGAAAMALTDEERDALAPVVMCGDVDGMLLSFLRPTKVSM
jgi:hypothetical protein